MLLPASVALLAGLATLQEGAGAAAQEAKPAQETAAAPARPGLENVFPQDSLIFAGIDDVAALVRDAEASAWGKLFADPEAEPVRAAFRSFVAALGKSSQDELGLDMVEAISLVNGRVGTSVSGTLGSEEDFSFVIAADAGERAVELRDRIIPLFDKLVEKGEAAMKVEQAGDVDFVTVVPTQEGDVSRIHLGASGGTLAFGAVGGKRVEGDDFARFVTSLGPAGAQGDVLAQLPAFRESLAARPGGVKAFVDLGRILRSTVPADAEDDPDVAQKRALGLLDLGALSARFALDAREMRLDAHQVWGAGWLPKILDAWLVGGDSTLLKTVPAEVVSAFSFHLDLVNGFEVTRAAIKEMEGYDPFAEETAPEGEADPGAAPKLDPRKDFLEHLDGRVALFVQATEPEEALPFMAMSGGPAVNFGLVLGVKNADALRTSVDALARQVGVYAARQRSEFEGFEVFMVPVMPGASLYYSIVSDFVVLSMSPTMLQDVLRRKSNAELPSLATNPGFVRQLEAMTHAHAILMWGKSSQEFMAGAAGGAQAGLMSNAMTFDEEGNVVEGEPPAEDSVEARGLALAMALGALDPTLIAKHLPAGQLLGLAVNEQGISLEAVSR